MPGRDGTGPEGTGSKTGRGLGPCEMLHRKMEHSLNNEGYFRNEMKKDVEQSSLENTRMRAYTTREKEIASLRERVRDLDQQIRNLRHRIERTESKKARMVARVDARQCQGCGVCVDFCPVDAIEVDDIAVIDSNTCIGCGACVTKCPFDAISLN
jgi:ferredoxin